MYLSHALLSENEEINNIYSMCNKSIQIVNLFQTSLLMTILGELPLNKGDRQVQGTIAYVPQEPWVLSDTVRRNIIMELEFDQGLYDSVLEACTLDVVSSKMS